MSGSITVLVGDLFESQAQTLVNTVNCVGVMGKGIALEFKKRFPEMFADYVERCRRQEVKLGEPYLYSSLVPPWVLNFPTKDHWRSITNLRDIVRGLEYLEEHYQEWGITSLAVPPLGCGQGQLEWRIVGPTLYRYLSRLDIPVELYAPHDTSHEELQIAFLQAEQGESSPNLPIPPPEHIPPEWVALVEIVKQIHDQPYHYPIGRTVLQKIAYVATVEGLPTGLIHQQASFGPFSPQLKKTVALLLNNGLLQETSKGKGFVISPGPTYPDARKAYKADLNNWKPLIEKVVDLFLRLNTQEAEVVATVLFAEYALREGLNRKTLFERPSENDVLKYIMEWKKQRTPPFTEERVANAIRNLAALGWMDVSSSPDLPVREEF
jgi:O-acetyl-ADP-ribose deacetylase (regulator of RNase III)/uncharacterized protein YwgA